MNASHLVDPVAFLLRSSESRRSRLLIGLSGEPGAGKSTVAASWADSVNQAAGRVVMAALGMDGYHLTRARLKQMPDPAEAFRRRGAPWTFDVTALRDALQGLRSSYLRGTWDWPGFDHALGDPVKSEFQVGPGVPVVLVEGLYLLSHGDGWAEVARQFDERWYLDVPRELANERLARRHMAAWGWSRDAAEERIAGNDALNGQVVAESRSFADRIITCSEA